VVGEERAGPRCNQSSRVIGAPREWGCRITIAAPSIPETEAGREVSSRAAAASRTSALRSERAFGLYRVAGVVTSLFLSHALSLYRSSIFLEIMSRVLFLSAYGEASTFSTSTESPVFVGFFLRAPRFLKFLFVGANAGNHGKEFANV